MKKHSRRVVFALLCATALTACAAPLVPPETAATIDVRSVSVDVGRYEGITGRNLTVSPERLKTDLTAALTRELAVSASGNSDLTVQVSKVFLLSPGAAALIGGPGSNSAIVATVSVTDAVGNTVLAPTEIRATSENFRLGGVIGVMMTPKPEDDYIGTVNGFAKSVKKRLLGDDKDGA